MFNPHLVVSAPAVLIPFPEAGMTEDYINNLPAPFNNRVKGQPYRWNFVSKGVPKVGGGIPKGNGYRRFLCQSGSAVETLEMLKAELWRRKSLQNTVPVIIKPTQAQELEIQMILRDMQETPNGIGIYQSFDLGRRIRITQQEEKLKSDAYSDAIRCGRAALVSVGQALREFVDSVGDPHDPPLIKNRRQDKIISYHLQFIADAVNPNQPFLELVREPKKLKKLYQGEIVKEGTLKLSFSYRKKIAQTFWRFSDFALDQYGLRIPSHVFEDKPTGESRPVVAPTPDVLKKFLHLILTQHIELLLFVVLQLCMALRPEEAFRALDNPMQYIIDDRFYFPARPGKSKASTRKDRNVRIRPLTWALLKRVPGLLDGTRTDFRPSYGGGQKWASGQDAILTSMQREVYELLRHSGFDPEEMPDEAFRKAMLSSLIGLRVENRLVMQEASHSNPDTLDRHYNAQWSIAMGLAFWKDMFPEDEPPHNFSDFELYAAFDQKPETQTKTK